LTSRNLLLLLAFILIISCGGKGKEQVLSSQGTGSNSLLVIARVTATNIFHDGSNAPEKFITRFRVDIKDKAKEPVTGADVTFTGSFGTISLKEEPHDSGRYVNTLVGHHLIYTLFVQSNSDYIKEAFCSGPDIHAITFPATGTSVSPDTPLTIQWTRTTEAEKVLVKTSNFDSSEAGPPANDTGTYTIPLYAFPSLSTTTTEEVTVTRGNDVDLTTSGVPGSSLTVEVENSVSFHLGQ